MSEKTFSDQNCEGGGMATRQAGAALAAAVYSSMHYIVVTGEVLKGFGWQSPPYPVRAVFEICFLSSILFLLHYLLPKLLRFNIFISAMLLKFLSWLDEAANWGAEHCRQLAIEAAESVVGWLRSAD